MVSLNSQCYDSLKRVIFAFFFSVIEYTLESYKKNTFKKNEVFVVIPLKISIKYYKL